MIVSSGPGTSHSLGVDPKIVSSSAVHIAEFDENATTRLMYRKLYSAPALSALYEKFLDVAFQVAVANFQQVC